MTREILIRVRTRALRRRDGQRVEIDPVEGGVMVAQYRAGSTIEAIAQLHNVPPAKVTRRLFTMGAFAWGT